MSNNVRYVVLLLTLIVAVGCNQKVDSLPNPLDAGMERANLLAGQTAEERDWEVTEKVVTKDEIKLVLRQKNPMWDRVNNRYYDKVSLTIEPTHRFFSEFDELNVGDVTYFLHMSHMGGSQDNPVTFLAPSSPVTNAYWSNQYSY